MTARRNNRWTAASNETFVRVHESCASQTEVAAKLKVSRAAVSARAKRLRAAGVKLQKFVQGPKGPTRSDKEIAALNALAKRAREAA